MSRHEHAVPVPAPHLDATHLWLLAVLGFGVGDLVTTTIGLGLTGVVEQHPLAAGLFSVSPLGAMLLLKAVVFGVCYALWKRTARPHCVGVPLGLAACGVLVTAWNVRVLLQAAGL